jgi:hypothetical protein
MSVTRDHDRKIGSYETPEKLLRPSQSPRCVVERGGGVRIDERALKIDEHEGERRRPWEVTVSREGQVGLNRGHGHPLATAWVALEPET